MDSYCLDQKEDSNKDEETDQEKELRLVNKILGSDEEGIMEELAEEIVYDNSEADVQSTNQIY